jgi:polygalacturonase
VRNGDDCVPVFPPTRNLTVEDLRCECGNGVVAAVWPLYSVPGQGGDISDVTFRNVWLNRTGTGVCIKSLPSYVGSVTNVVYDNVTMLDVTQAVMFNVFDQNVAAAASSSVGAQSMPKLGVARVANVTVRNVVGTAGAAGKVQCDPSAPCDGFVFENITIDTSKGYTCEHASGTATGCKPQPCGWGS